MSVIKFDHYIQAEIFAKLRKNPTVRYKDLKDPGLESSQFMYHLTELMRRKLVEKVARGEYRLTPDGSGLAQLFSSDQNNLRVAPLTYTLIFLRSTKGNWYVVERGKHPFIGYYGCISGKVHMEETLEQAASRELHEGTGGLVETSLKYCGYASVMVKQRNEGFTAHVTGPVWFADSVEETSQIKMAAGTGRWCDWQELPYEKFIPGWKEIIEKLIEAPAPGFLDFSSEL